MHSEKFKLDFRTKMLMSLCLSYTLILGNIQTKFSIVAAAYSLLPYVFLLLNREKKAAVKGILFIMAAYIIQKEWVFSAGGFLGSLFLFITMMFLRLLPGFVMARFALASSTMSHMTSALKIIKKYTELLDTEKLLNRNIFSLSGGEKQLMAITSVMTMDNQVYLFDEPSASLDHHSIGLLKKCIAELKRKGKIVIIAEHRLYYLKEIMDYLAVLKEGKLEMISVEDLDHDKICRLKETYALRSFEEIRKEELLSDNPCYQIQMLNKTKNGEKDKNILKCKNFAQSFKNTKIMDIGEIGFSEGIYFIIGENGVGKSTFIKKMAKLLKGKGKSFYCGNEIKRSYEYISMVMQDVNYQIFTESVWSEISIVSQDDAKKERVLKELMLYDK